MPATFATILPIATMLFIVSLFSVQYLRVVEARATWYFAGRTSSFLLTFTSNTPMLHHRIIYVSSGLQFAYFTIQIMGNTSVKHAFANNVDNG